MGCDDILATIGATCVQRIRFSAANTAIGGDTSGYGLARGFAEGGIVGSLALLCAGGACGLAATAVGTDLAVGGAQCIYDYAVSGRCHSAWGYAKAAGYGAFNNAPIPFERLFRSEG